MKIKHTVFLIILFLLVSFFLFKKSSYLKHLIYNSNQFSSENDKQLLYRDSIAHINKIDSLKKRLNDLKIEEKFWKNRIKMAKNSSVDLVIDFIDSVVILEMKGVPLKQSKIIEYQFSNTLNKIVNSDSLIHFIDNIFIVEDDWATIPKEPIVVKEAPKAPLDIDKDSPTEIPVDTGKVHFLLHLNNDLSIQIDPQQKKQDQIWIIKNKYDTWIPTEPEEKQVRMLLECIPPLQKYWIKLQVDNDDARVIYRALSSQAELTIRL